MKTEILLSALFFLIGIISGAVIVGYIVYRHLTSQSEFEEVEEDLRELDEIPFPFSEIKKVSLKDIIQNAEPITPNVVFDTITDIDNFKKSLEAKLHKFANDGSDDYDKAIHVRDLLKSVDSWYEIRKKWFLDRIGKRVKPSEAECPCEGCERAVKDGLVIQNDNMALSLFAQENRSKVNQGKLRYSDYEG